MSEINLLYIDLFCGAGGTSTGVESARIDGEQCAKVIACVNHDANAIASHAANHPEALHFTEDIRTLELSPLVEHFKKSKVQYPSASVVLWASLECTNFSKAKGGQPRDADSRTLAEHLFRYIEAIDPDYIQIENVEEFMSWGPMDENGKPLSMQKGKDYTKWVCSVKSYGYNFDHRILNAADFGAYTSRKRFFGIFAKHGLPIVFPEPTHCKEGKQDMFSDLKKWKAVKEVLDFEDEGTSIFGRKKEPVEATKARLYSGLIKFVAGGKDAFMVKWNSMSQSGKYQAPDMEAPSPTVSCQNRLGVAKVSFMSKQFSGHPESKNVSLERPAGAITCIDHHAIVNTDFLAAYYGNGDNVSQVDRPCPTVPTKDRFNYVRPMFLSMYYGGDNHAGAIDKPAPTIRTKDCCSLVSTRFFDMQYGTGKCTSIHKPAGTVTATPKHNLITCRQWLMNTSFGNTGSSIEVPSQVITANRKWHYLVNPQYSSAGGNINSPCFTLIARMDKMPPYLAECTTEPKDIPSFIRIDGNVVIYEIYDTDSPMTVKLKEFMALYGILDIKMRMLKIPELKRIMGFPDGYKLIGTQADQKKFIGNAVEVTMARVLCEAVSRKLRELRKVAA
jgi:DNA (cytosine-5)-methyltransferase 1